MKNNENYCLPENYTRRPSYEHFDDTSYRDEYQDDVYGRAREIYEESNLNSVLDIGCGSGFKLIKYFSDSDNICGMELEPTLTWLKNSYPNYNWIESDFNSTNIINYDLLICSDVIEHIVDPDELMQFISNLNFKYCIMSTPERDAIQMYQFGKFTNGPPRNHCHTMEWAFSEYNNYISKYFNVIEHKLANSSTAEGKLCQYVVFKKYE
jgi:SAM-dependent methyltransferase